MVSQRRFEKLVEKVERLEEENRRLKKEDVWKDAGEATVKEEVSRRSFLKKLGAGVVSLGALSLAPVASKVSITNTGITKDGNSFWHQGNLVESNYLKIDGSIPMSGALDLGGNDLESNSTQIWDSENSQIPSGVIQTSGLDADTLDGEHAAAFSVPETTQTAVNSGGYTHMDDPNNSDGSTSTLGNTESIGDVSGGWVSYTFPSSWQVEICDGLRVYPELASWGELQQIKVTFTDGTTSKKTGIAGDSQQWYEFTFPANSIEKVELYIYNSSSNYDDLGFRECQPHLLPLPAHSHDL